MWDHRNHALHAINGGLHCDERIAIDRAIREEFIIGKDDLDETMFSFFRGNVNRILGFNANSKIQWLASVWGERDRARLERGLGVWYKDPMAEAFLVRHKMRKKRKREEYFAAL